MESSTRLQRAIPILQWLPAYKREYVSGDVLAGIIVAALMVTEAVAYSGIIGVPVIVGLSAVPFCLIAYAVLGSSPQLIVGPLATMAAISGSVVVSLSDGNASNAVAITCALAIATGLVLIAAAALRLGWIAEFLSRPILAGFISGLVILIIVGQLPDLLGVKGGSGNTVQKFLTVLGELGTIHWLTALVGFAALAILVIGHRFAPRLPWSFIVLVLGIIASAALDLAGHGVAIVGDIASGIPSLSIPSISASDIPPIVVGGATLAIVGLAEALSVARLYAIRGDYRIRTNQEFVGQGASNLLAGLFGGFAICGSLVKTAAAARAHGKTQMTSLVAAALGLAVLLGLDQLLTDLPDAVLAAIIINAVAHMFAAREIAGFWKVKRSDFVAAMVCLVAVLLISTLYALLLGVGIALAAYLYRSSRVRTDSSEADGHASVRVVRLESPLFWPNAQGLSDTILDMAAATPALDCIVLDLSGTTQIDITSAEVLEEVQGRIAKQGIALLVACDQPEVIQTLTKSGFLSGDAHCFPTVQAAVASATSASKP